MIFYFRSIIFYCVFIFFSMKIFFFKWKLDLDSVVLEYIKVGERENSIYVYYYV